MNWKKMNETQMALIKLISEDFFKQLSTAISPIRFLWLVPFLLALSAVFVVSGDLAYGVVSGKYFWFYGSMGLVGLATLINTLIDKHSFRFSAIDLLVLFFAAAVYLPAWLGDAVPNTTKLTILTLLAVLYFSFRLIINTFNRKDITRHILCIFIIFTGLVEAVWGLRQLYGFLPSQHSLFKLTGSFFNPGPYAGYLAVVFPIALQYFIVKDRKRKMLRFLSPVQPWLGGITCLIILLVLPAAMSRASWLAAIAGSGIVIYARYSDLVRKFYQRHKKTVWISGCVIVLLLSVAAAGMYYLKKNSADGRLLTWKTSLQTIVEHPFGVGLGNFPSAYGETQAAYFALGQASETEELVAGNPEYGFNEYLQIAIESGIIALLLFIGIIILTVRSMVKARNWGMLGSLIALLVFAGFSYPFSVLPFLIVFVFLLATNQSCHPAPDAGSSDNRSVKGFLVNQANKFERRVKPAMTGSIILLLIVTSCLWKQYPVYRAYKQWKSDQIYYHAGLYKETAKSYVSLYPHLNDQIRFLFEYAQSLSKAGLDEKQRIEIPTRCDSLLNKSNQVLRRAMQISCDPMLYNIMGKNYQAMKQYKQAEVVFTKSAQLVPSRLYPWYLLAKLYAEMGMDEKAAETAKIVLTKEPKVQSPAVREMREEVKELRVKN